MVEKTCDRFLNIEYQTSDFLVPCSIFDIQKTVARFLLPIPYSGKATTFPSGVTIKYWFLVIVLGLESGFFSGSGSLKSITT